jgi:hypothetical protein
VIAEDFRGWIRERRNHACLAIWDASNETPYSQDLYRAIRWVRHLDLQNRPWENSECGIPDDDHHIFECHPYYSGISPFGKDLNYFNDALVRPVPNVSPVGRTDDKPGHPKIVNEYVFLWLKRDGEPTDTSRRRFRRLLGRNSTEDQRRYLLAMHVASATELWRNHPDVTGVHYFASLHYSTKLPGGGKEACSDHWIGDIAELQSDPYFEKYVRDAFAPVGLMIYHWWNSEPPVTPGARETIDVFIKNDTWDDWQGEVALRTAVGRDVPDTYPFRTLWREAQDVHVPATGQLPVSFRVSFPTQAGRYKLIAEYADAGGELVQSVRDFTVR